MSALMNAVGRALDAATREEVYDHGSGVVMTLDHDDFLRTLNENGFDIVPNLIVGPSGLRPDELDRFQQGVMWERARQRERRGEDAFAVGRGTASVEVGDED